jgi:hypothetical protein
MVVEECPRGYTDVHCKLAQENGGYGYKLMAINPHEGGGKNSIIL